MKKTFLIIISLISLFILNPNAWSKKRGTFSLSSSDTMRIEIPIETYFHNSGRIFIKKELKNLSPHLKLKTLKLLSVRLIAKSKYGQGLAQLRVGNQIQDSTRILGDPDLFKSPRPKTYDRVSLKNHERASRGPWQILLDGEIKVKKIILRIASKKQHPDRRERFQIINLGGGTAHKFVETSKSFRVRDNVESLQIIGTKRILKIVSVVVEYRDGALERLSELEGYLNKGSIRSAYLGGAGVMKVTVTSITKIPFGARGKYKIRAQVYR